MIMPETIEFFNQWTKRPVTAPQEFKEPTCTVPDQSMTIQEIIAKFTRTGLVPQSFVQKDNGGNEAFEPGFDPLDQYADEIAAAKAADGASAPASKSAPEVAGESAQGQKGEGGD